MADDNRVTIRVGKDLDILRSLVPAPPGPNGGQPSVVTIDVLILLRQAFLIGANDEEACAYANLPTSTFYNYQKTRPEFLELKEAWKKQPILGAKQAVVGSFKDNPHIAFKYLERKAPEEFSDKSEDKPNQQLNIIVNDSKFADRLTGLFDGADQGSNPPKGSET